MTETRCAHGMDRRFCAICNGMSRGGGLSALSGAAGTSLEEILRFLNDTRLRATDGAVASVLGLSAQSLGTMLGARRPEASWVVNSETGLPTGYEQVDWHADLLTEGRIIRTGNELTLRLALWRAGST